MIPTSFYEEWNPVAGDIVVNIKTGEFHRIKESITVDDSYLTSDYVDCIITDSGCRHYKCLMLPTEVDIPWEVDENTASPVCRDVVVECCLDLGKVEESSWSFDWYKCSNNVTSFKIPSSQFESIEPEPDYTATNEYEPPNPVESTVKVTTEYTIDNNDPTDERYGIVVHKNYINDSFITIRGDNCCSSIDIHKDHIDNLIEVLQTIKENM